MLSAISYMFIGQVLPCDIFASPFLSCAVELTYLLGGYNTLVRIPCQHPYQNFFKIRRTPCFIGTSV